jgi:prepilin-type N-terminal cleavage/methylation domain-containing protein
MKNNMLFKSFVVGGEKATFRSGFTLIELLVVIAIIGILSSVVLASLNSARVKGANAAVKANLSNLRKQAEIYYDNQTPSGYGSAFVAAACPSASNTSMFWADAQIQAAISQAASAGGGGMPGTRCATDGTNYAVSAKLKSMPNYWCVDSSGAARIVSDGSWAGVKCPP